MYCVLLTGRCVRWCIFSFFYAVCCVVFYQLTLFLMIVRIIILHLAITIKCEVWIINHCKISLWINCMHCMCTYSYYKMSFRYVLTVELPMYIQHSVLYLAKLGKIFGGGDFKEFLDFKESLFPAARCGWIGILNIEFNLLCAAILFWMILLPC